LPITFGAVFQEPDSDYDGLHYHVVCVLERNYRWTAARNKLAKLARHIGFSTFHSIAKMYDYVSAPSKKKSCDRSPFYSPEHPDPVEFAQIRRRSILKQLRDAEALIRRVGADKNQKKVTAAVVRRALIDHFGEEIPAQLEAEFFIRNYSEEAAVWLDVQSSGSTISRIIRNHWTLPYMRQSIEERFADALSKKCSCEVQGRGHKTQCHLIDFQKKKTGFNPRHFYRSALNPLENLPRGTVPIAAYNGTMLFGESGAGKSTLFNGLVKILAGRIREASKVSGNSVDSSPVQNFTMISIF
jgi:hypothetical protein